MEDLCASQQGTSVMSDCTQPPNPLVYLKANTHCLLNKCCLNIYRRHWQLHDSRYSYLGDSIMSVWQVLLIARECTVIKPNAMLALSKALWAAPRPMLWHVYRSYNILLAGRKEKVSYNVIMPGNTVCNDPHGYHTAASPFPLLHTQI